MKQLLTKLKNRITSSKGFTLIELLIVIAVLGVLAGVVLVAIDPTEQLAKANDSSNFNKVSTIANAWQSYLTSQNATTYPAVAANWQNTLVNAGELSAVMTGNATPACVASGNSNHSDICYATFNTNANAMVWITMKSKANIDKAAGTTATTCGANEQPAYVWASTLSKAGLACINTTTPALPTAVY